MFTAINTKLTIYHVHAFTGPKYAVHKRAKGSATGVCVLKEELSPEEMLAVAQELNYPVTAFIQKGKPDKHNYSIRYYTPAMEIPVCGHASLASAKLILDIEKSINTILYTASGATVTATKKEDKVMLVYPRYKLKPITVSKNILRSIGLDEYVSAGLCTELGCLFLELHDAAVLNNVQPDFKQLLAADNSLQEIVLTAASDEPAYDYMLRAFCPWIGIDEDPATGSVHSVLAHFWKERLGKDHLKVYQASKEGGEAFVTAFDNHVGLSGRAEINY